MIFRWISLVVLTAVAVAGCGPSQQNEDLVPSDPVLPSQGDIPSMTQTPIAPEAQGPVDAAKEELALRLSIDVDEIDLVEAKAVVWPDSSLGCPQEGFAYAQVLTPGYLIVLQYGNDRYEYHAGHGPDVIYCSNPQPPVPGVPGNT